MKYYIYEQGECVSTARFVGNFEYMYDAKEKFFNEMCDGDKIVEFPDDCDPEITDKWGYNTVNLDMATDIVTFYTNDGSIEDVPEGVFYWSDEDERYYNEDGTVWQG